MKLRTLVITGCVVLFLALVLLNIDQIKAMTGNKPAAGGDGKNVLDQIKDLFGHSGAGNQEQNGPTPSGLNKLKVLKNGVTAPEVGQLQTMLNIAHPASPLVVDNAFGPLTEARLQQVTGRTQITLGEAEMLMWNFMHP